MIKISIIYLIAISFLFTSCWSPTEPVPPVEMRDLTVAEKEVVGSANTFGLRLLEKLSEVEGPGENIFISPLSISMALGMTLNGAKENTLAEMKDVLGFSGLSIEEINESYRGLLDLLPHIDPDVEMLIANSIWYREGFPVLDEFIGINKEYFDAEVEGLDFSAPDASDIMNDWVEQKTNGLIDSIVPDNIHPLTMMFLINAMYFKGNWTLPFDEDDTHDAEFRLTDGSTVDVKMMRQESEYRYHQSSDFSIIDIPYGDEYYSMTVVLPPEGVSIYEFIASMNSNSWESWLAAIPDEGREINLYLPRFTLEYEKSLPEILEAMGMVDAFDADYADFTGMYDKMKEYRNLFIADVMHKTFVDVNEEGTEAAAATSVEMRLDSAPPSFRVDRPFLMAIRERSSDAILFIGKIVNPEG